MSEKMFEEVALEWLEEKRLIVKPSTYYAYLLVVRKHLIPSLGSLRQVGEDEGRRLAFSKAQQGLSRKTIHEIVRVLKDILSYSSGHYGNQFSKMDIKLPASSRFKAVPTLTLHHHRLLLSYLIDHTDSRNIGVLIALCTGMRIGEVCALQWDDINWIRRVISVRRTIGRIYDADNMATMLVISSPKTEHSNREIPLNAGLVGALKRIRKTTKGAYVVGSGRKVTDPRGYREYFRRLMKRLGIPPIVFHGLRHTFATRCIESQCDYKTLSALLGHANVTTTLNLYVHPGIEQKKSCINRLDRYLGGKR